MKANEPVVYFTKPRADEVWKVLIYDPRGKLRAKVREMNNGTIQLATEDHDWFEA